MKRILAAVALLAAAPIVMAQSLQAHLQWASPVELSSPESGVVREVLVAPGDRVEPGAVLLRLERRDRLAALRAAEARVAYRREALAEAGRERDRTQELYDRTLLSDHDLQLAGIAWLKAEAEHKHALARLSQRQLALEYAELTAPYPALVTQLRVAPGQTVSNRLRATPMVSVARSDRMRASAEVDLDQASALQQGQALQVQVDGTTLDGVLIDPGLVAIEKDATRRYVITVEFDWPAQRNWRAGQPARILLP